MSKKQQKLSPPKPTAGDLAHSAVRAAIGAASNLIPVYGASAAGSAALEIFNNVFSPPYQKRCQKWMEDVAEAIQELQRQGCKIEDLQNSETFVTTVMQASQIAVRNHEQEKLEALRNAVLNSALPQAPDDSLQQMFLALVDRFTVWHLRILALFDNPKEWFTANNRQFPTFMTSSLANVLTEAYPELRNQRTFYDVIYKDLWNNGLTNTDSLQGMMTAHGAAATRTSDIGKQFLRFITKPK